MSDNGRFMDEALKEAYKGIESGHGGPFGSVVVKDNKIVGKGHNRVLSDHDPTMHGEVAAIRDACKKLQTHDLSGCVLYTTAEPCPMCLGAILWSGIKTVYYGCNVLDTENIGFRDEIFYNFIKSGEGLDKICTDREKCLELFKAYSEKEDKELY